MESARLMRRVVVTGVGAVTPVGNTAPEIWRNPLAGKSGIGHITLFDASDYSVNIAGEVKGFSPEGIIDPKEARHMDRAVQFAVVATKEALQDAKLDINEQNADDVGRVLGTGAGGVGLLLEQQEILERR